MGHALAAAAEGVGLHYMAVFALVFLPGALVALDVDTLSLLSPSRKLRVPPTLPSLPFLLLLLCSPPSLSYNYFSSVLSPLKGPFPPSLS